MKEKFNQLISAVVKPLLKQNGFTKKGLNFYKRNDDLVFLINFQNSTGNTLDQTKFYINCGIHSNLIDKVIGTAELKEPKEYECYFKKRIASIVNSDIDDYVINKNIDFMELSLVIAAHLNTVIAMFNNIKNIKDLTDLMIQHNGLNNYKELFEFLLLTKNDTDLKHFVKNLYEKFGSENRWKIFENNLSKLLIDNNRQDTIADIIKE